MDERRPGNEIPSIPFRKKKKTEMDADETDHKKKTISEILFGEPDEDDIEEEALFKEEKAKKEALL